jgi:hypothetical protein
MAYIKREELINLVTFHHGKTKSLKQRFLEKVGKKRKNDCIHWNGYKSITSGHGVISIRLNGKSYMYKAHRLAYQFYINEIPKGKLVLHNCNNVKCVNPYHLRIGTQKENVLDRIKDGTDNKGERHGMSKLTIKQVKKIKKMKINDLEIAKIFNVSRKAIYDIKHQRTWSHII